MMRQHVASATYIEWISQYCTWNSFSSDAKARPAAGYILTLVMQRMSLRNTCAGAAKSLALYILQQPVTDMVRGAFQGT